MGGVGALVPVHRQVVLGKGGGCAVCGVFQCHLAGYGPPSARHHGGIPPGVRRWRAESLLVRRGVSCRHQTLEAGKKRGRKHLTNCRRTCIIHHVVGRLAQLVEHALDVRRVSGSSPLSSTIEKSRITPFGAVRFFRVHPGPFLPMLAPGGNDHKQQRDKEYNTFNGEVGEMAGTFCAVA